MSGVRLPARVLARGRVFLPPLVVAVVVLGAWQAFVDLDDVQPYLLPSPSAIAHQFREHTGPIRSAAWVSGVNAAVGLALGAIAGLVAAVVAARSRLIDGMLAPVAAAMNAIPIIVLAPLFNAMFSTTSSVPRRAVVAVVVFFPVFVNTARGLREVAPVHRELMRSLAVGPWRFARTVSLPGALPFFFTGLRLASSLAVIAAVVAEYFGGRQNGLGSRITSAAANSAYPRAWAFVVAACLLGLLFYLVVLAVERAATPWRRHGGR
ncbi:ABC transporter permease subunit [Frankia sp. AvcI1]|uniref:ABC transporter permease n=1 Tax=Frankia sp. AvcI1 TaxID=573496 RepID=UPI0021175BDD|nr:ABC transporter permease subunit [Frankia sp. AvcI1]